MMEQPVALDAACSTALLEALRAAAARDRDSVLAMLLADAFTRKLLLAVDITGTPLASVVQVVKSSDPLAKWADLSCI